MPTSNHSGEWRPATGSEAIPRLPPRIRSLIRYGDRDERYASRSNVIQAILTSAVHRGYPRDLLFEELIDSNSAGGEWLRVDYEGHYVSRVRGRGRFDRSWAKAEAFVAKSPGFKDRAGA